MYAYCPISPEVKKSELKKKQKKKQSGNEAWSINRI